MSMRLYDNHYDKNEARINMWAAYDDRSIKYENGLLVGNTYRHKDAIKFMFNAKWNPDKKGWEIAQNFRSIFEGCEARTI